MDEDGLRHRMVELGRRAYQQGYIVAGEGNLSARLDGDILLVTPAGRNKGFLAPDDLVRVDLHGDPLPGEGRPSSEIRMHTAVYRFRPDAQAVVHTHAPVSTACAVAGIALDEPLLAESVLFLGKVPVAPYGTPSTDELPASMAELIPDHDALLLANHGTLTLGRDLDEAFDRLEILEHTARVVLLTRLLGGAQPIPPHKVEELLRLGSRSV